MVTNKKNTPKLTPLSMVEIIMRADVETIRAALEARQKIDALLAERAAAYERIAALEAQINTVVGGSDQFIFPPPPVPVAAYAAATVAAAPAPAKAAAPAIAAAASAAAAESAEMPESAVESAEAVETLTLEGDESARKADTRRGKGSSQN